MANSPTVLITGAGSGLGLASGLHLASLGYRVFGTVLTDGEAAAMGAAAQARGVQMTPIPCDITKSDQIRSACRDLFSQTSRLDALVHFAGLGLRGFFEDLGMDEIRKVYDVNVFGAMELTQAILPYMREQRSGRIIITSSAAGRMGAMSISGYSSSKFALEGWGECLAPEVRGFNIFVSMLEPGLIATPHFQVNRNRARKAKDPASPYFNWFVQHEHIVDGILERAQFSIEDVAALVHRILTAKSPKLRYMIGRKAKMLTGIRRYTPFDLFDRIYWPIVRRVVTSPKKQASGLS